MERSVTANRQVPKLIACLAAVVLIPGFIQIGAANQKLQPIYEAAGFSQISRVLQIV